MRAAEAQRHAEALGRCRPATSAPDSPGAGSRRQREQVGRDRDQRAARVGGGDDRGEVADRAGRARGTARSTPKNSPSGSPSASRSATHDLDAQRLGPGADHGDRLRQAVGVDDVHGAPAPWRPAGPASSPRRRRWPRRAATRWRSARPVRSATMVWKLSSASSRPWRDLRLVRRVRRVPGRVLQHVAPDHRRRERAVVAEADHARPAAGCGRPARAARPAPRARSAAGGQRRSGAVSADRAGDRGGASARPASE